MYTNKTMVQFNNKKLLYSALGAVAVISGVLLKNGYENIKAPEPNLGTKLGPLVFGLGWIITALSIATTKGSASLFNLQMNRHGVLAMFASAMIFFSVMKMKAHKKYKRH